MELWTEQIIQAHAGDKDARNRLVAENLGLVHAVTRRFEHRGHDREELFQIGCIGLMKAIDKFDVSLQLAFSTYAVPMITGEIRRFLRDDGMVKVSRTLKENGYKIRRAGEMLTRELGREPTMEELAEAAGLEREEIVLALEANREVASIYQPVYERDGEELLLIDQMEGSGGQKMCIRDRRFYVIRKEKERGQCARIAAKNLPRHMIRRGSREDFTKNGRTTAISMRKLTVARNRLPS